jgi:hypothetical protein
VQITCPCNQNPKLVGTGILHIKGMVQRQTPSVPKIIA